MNQNDEREFVILNVGYIVFIFLLSVFSVINALLLLILILPQTNRLILIINFGISVVLMADFLYTLFKTRASRSYLIDWHGWMAFIGSLPVPGLAIFRVLQSILAVRRIRGRDLAEASKLALRQRGRSTFLTTLFLGIVALEMTGILILRAESGASGAEIKTAQDALWWGYVTMSTVGYGDLVPVTTDGRIIGLITVTIGVVIFSVTTGFLADWFRGDRRSSRRAYADQTELAGDDPRRQVYEIRRLMDEQEQAYQERTAELRDRLDELERLLLP